MESRVCNCTLPYTNPEACNNCQNNTLNTNFWNYSQPKKRITKTIDRYDANGQYIGREIIVEEIEEIINNYDVVYNASSAPSTN